MIEFEKFKNAVETATNGGNSTVATLDERTKIQPDAILFTHTDLDGTGCGVLFKGSVGSKAQVLHCNYDNVDKVIQETIAFIRKNRTDRPQIIISDIGINEDTAKVVDRYEGERLLLDHHGTNMWLGLSYDWAFIDEQESGTLLMYHHMDVPEKYERFAIMVDDYDRWIHANPNSKQLNRLFFVLGINRFEERCLEREEPTEFDKTDELLLEIEDDNLERYINRTEKQLTVVPLSDDNQLGIVYADRYQSELGHELLDRYDIQAVAMIDPNKKTVSVRSVKKFDVSHIIERLGGGGHKNAAGVGFNYKKVKEFHGARFPLLGVQEGIEGAKYEFAMKFNLTHREIENEIVEEMMSNFQGGM